MCKVKLFLDAGRDFSMVFVEQGKDGIKVNEGLVEAMIERIKANGIGMIFVDPFVGCHAVNENDIYPRRKLGLYFVWKTPRQTSLRPPKTASGANFTVSN